MSKIRLENDSLVAEINTFGAELTSLQNKTSGLEYIWQAGEEWSKHSPVLFPIVGQLKDNKYTYNGNAYTLNRHGFARESEFELFDQNADSLCLVLSSNDKTKAIYPFDFHFYVIYELKGNTLEVHYKVENDGEETMYYSAGGHPAFNVPLVSGMKYADYKLRFDQPIVADRWVLESGLIKNESIPCMQDETMLELSKELFAEDAIVFKKVNANSISLRATGSTHGLTMKIEDCNYLGLWAAKEADFVCIEPWWGIADSVDASGELSKKEGILSLEPEEDAFHSFSIKVF